MHCRMLLNNKFGVAIEICNQLSLGWGTREQRKNIIMKNKHKNGVSKKNEKGTNNEKSK